MKIPKSIITGMNEIGGYFGLEDFVHKEYYEDLIAVNSGRYALLYILKAKKIKKLYLPYYLCDSVSKLCEKETITVDYYSIDKSFHPVFEQSIGNDEAFYLVNYCGQLTEEDIRFWKEKYNNLIVDNVQAFFQKPIPEVDTIYSCRKFFGVPDGGYVSTDVLLEEALPIDISKERMRHILGRYEGSASDYYNDFKQNDEIIENAGLRFMSKLTHNLMGAIDYEKVKIQREKNYKYLHKRLGPRNKLSLTIPQGPYAYPFYCKNGMEIKKRLAKQTIYIPTLWPNVLGLEGTLEKDYTENILPLPVDQRYEENEISLIAETVNNILVS